MQLIVKIEQHLNKSRDRLLQSLLSLVDIPNASTKNVSTCVLKTLHELVLALQSRIHYCRDPAVFQPRSGNTLSQQDIHWKYNQFNLFADEAANATSSTLTDASLMSQSLRSSDSHNVFVNTNRRRRGDGQDDGHSANRLVTECCASNGII